MKVNEVKIATPGLTITKKDVDDAIFDMDNYDYNNDDKLTFIRLVVNNRIIINNIKNRLNISIPIKNRTAIAWKLAKNNINLEDDKFWETKTEDFGNGTGWEPNKALISLVDKIPKNELSENLFSKKQ
jgi:hypothetical protein